MNLIKRIYQKLYLRHGEILLGKSNCTMHAGLEKKKNLFIYFDYEREFSGHETNITDQNIDQLLGWLNEYQFKTTWFTVGKIFEKYPRSISAILAGGHEIGSHTYKHKAPYRMTGKEMSDDFNMFDEASRGFTMVRGFHSPNGLWSLSMFRYLRHYDYHYDVYRKTGRKIAAPYNVSAFNRKAVTRLQTIGDDWPLFVKRRGAEEVFNYLKNLASKIQNGDVAGIGFHPWVLFSDPQIMEGFKMFLDYLRRRADFNIQPARDFVIEHG